MSTPPRTSYDEVPYESHPFAQTHPDRLATIATLLGLRPPPVDRCRVLELGCAAGGNLIPMALTLPDSTFAGIDLSAVEIADGQRMIEALGLANIRLEHTSILDVGPDFGRFDYLLCHGVYSWVPAAVQDRILDICKHHLNPNGVAYISYNTYPGWHMRGMIRDMLGYHVRYFGQPHVRVKQARNLLDFLARTVAGEQTPYSLLLKNELESFRRSSDSYLFHEHLEEVNEPIYFYQFVERAQAKGLQYLGEADLRTMVPANYPPEVESVLQMLAQDNVHMEQYMDFLRNRMFRQTLLCHNHQRPSYALRPEQLTAFHVASPARPLKEEADLRSDEPEEFQGPDGVTLSSRDPLVKAAMRHLAQNWPRAVPFKELRAAARARLDSATEVEPATVARDTQTLGQALLTFYASASTSLVELSLCPPRLPVKVGERPAASPLARLQAAEKGWVTNLRHEQVGVGELERCLLRLLDGSRDRAALVAAVAELVQQGDLTVEQDGQPVRDAKQVRDLAAQTVEQHLTELARHALLVG
ncbi:MAG: class I SAM-dependent methyltransferase [Gemmataceae bacterium]|nr:class I SAM-dependent methyltransferase [Gemmataceae bacterium]